MSAPHIRPYREDDWPAVWRVMEPIIRAGETYCWDRDLEQARGRSFWLPRPPGATYVAVDSDERIVGTAELAPNREGGGAHVAKWQSLGFEIIATVPEGFHHPTHGYVGLHVMYRPLAA